MQTFLQVRYAGMSAKQPLADHGNISRQMVCRDVLVLMDRVSLLNGSQLVREMPMSLLECTTWTSPNVWIRTAYCSATFSATLSCLTSVVPTQAESSTVADVPSSTVAHTRFCDDHMLDIAACQWSSSYSSVFSET